VVKKVAKTRVKPGQAKVSAETRRAAFIEAYLSNGANATDAAIQAGFSPVSAASQGSRLLKNVNVAQEIARRRTEVVANLELSTERTLKEVSRIAFSDPRKLVDEKGKVKPLHELDDDTAAAIASFEVDKDGAIKYKFWDKNSAIEKAAKVQGLYEKDNDQKAPQVTVITRRVIG
jgi:phage terminase small subunit